jgi:O-methyltransferase
MNDRVFVHGGKAGDCILHLAAIEQLGGGFLRLWPSPHVGQPWTYEIYQSLRPLIEAQPYISGTRWADGGAGGGEFDLDIFRPRWKNWLNIQDILHDALGIDYYPRVKPWLHIDDPLRICPVLFARCPRYHNARMPWRFLYEKYKKYGITFVGLPDEHRELQEIVGPLAYYPTRDYLTLARVIAGCELFISNQSSPHAVAEGLKKPKILEVALNDNNCHWNRGDAWYVYRGGEEVPEMETVLAYQHTLITTDRLCALARGVEETAKLPGDMAELGVYQGGSAKVIAFSAPQKTLRLFDTFAGLPADDAGGGAHKAGEFAAPLEEVKKYLSAYRVEFHVGFFPETTAPVAEARYAFVHLDGDLYQTTKDALEYFWPRLVPGGLLYLDDVDWPNTPGVNRALQEAGLMERLERTAPNQGRLRKS